MSDDAQPGLPLVTISRFWQFDRALHNVGDKALWVPVRHRTIIWGALVFAPAWVLLAFAHIPWSGFGLTLHVVVPALAVWWIITQIENGVRPYDVVASWAGHAWAARPGDTPRTARVRSKPRMVRCDPSP